MKKLLLIIGVLLIAINCWAVTNTFQVGGVDTKWSTVGNWSAGHKPVASEDVVMNITGNCNIDENTVALNSFDQTGYTGVLSGTGALTITPASGTVVCKFQNGANHTWTGALNLNPPAGTEIDLTFNGTTHGAITITGTTTGKVVMQDAMTQKYQNFFFYGGTFDANDFDVNFSKFVGGNNCTLYMGNGTWSSILSSGEAWNTNYTITIYAEGSTISLLGNGTNTFTGGGKTFNNITIGTGTGILDFTGNNTFTTFTITATKTVKFAKSTTTTVTSFVATGDATHTITLDTTDGAGQFILSDSSGTNTVHYCTISHSLVIGGASWIATDHCTDGGGNSFWQFTSGVPYMITTTEE